MKLIIDCVWCSNRRDFVKFLKTADAYESVIDYYAINVKLSKSDPDGIQPTDTIIGLHLVKGIQDAKNNNKSKLLYVIKNLNAETIETVSDMFCSIYEIEENEMSISLFIINRDDYPGKTVLSKFDSVKFIEKV
jgi:hypothetical protein